MAKIKSWISPISHHQLYARLGTSSAPILLLLLGVAVTCTSARAQPVIDCKSCPIERKICRQAHSQQACDSEYAMCMKHCKKS